MAEPYDPNYDPIFEARVAKAKADRSLEEEAAIVEADERAKAFESVDPIQAQRMRDYARKVHQPGVTQGAPRALSTPGDDSLPTPPTPSLFRPHPSPPAKILPPEANAFVQQYPPLQSQEVQAAGPKVSPVRAVRMPNGKIVFTNLSGGGEELGEQEGRQAARSIGQAGPQAPPPDASNLASRQSYELVQRASEAPQNGGGFSAMELKPGDDGLATPGYYRQQEQQAEDRLGGYERRSALADAASRAKLAEAWAKMTPEDRLRAEAALKAAEKPNFPLQTIEHLQQQDAILAQQAQEIQRGLATIVNVDNPDTKRLKAEGAAKLAAIEAERKRLLEIGGLPFRADTSMIGAGGYNPYNPAGAGAITP